MRQTRLAYEVSGRASQHGGRCAAALALAISAVACLTAARADLTVPKALADQAQLIKNSAENPVDTPPNPLKLAADWWRYFAVEPAQLKTRIDTASQKLNEIVRGLPDDEKSRLNADIDHLSENLQTLLQLRSKPAVGQPSPQALQKTYTIRQWLDLVHQRRSLQAELDSEKEDLARDQKQYKAAQQDFDSQTAAYLTLPAQAQNKVSQGFAVMSAWTNLAIDQESLRLQKAGLAMQNTQLQQLDAAGNTALDRLFMSQDEIQQLKQEIATAQRELSAAQEKLPQPSIATVTGALANDLDKAKALLIEQRARQDTVSEAVADAVLIRKQTELVLARMLTAANDEEIRTLRTELQDLLDNIARLGSQSDLWREEIGRDQSRVGKSLAALFGSTATQNNDVILLTQQRLTEVQNTLLSLQRLESEIHDVRLLANRVQTLITAREGSFISGLERFETSFAKIWESVWEHLGTSLFKIGDAPVTILGILRVLIIVALAWMLSLFVRRGMTHLSQRLFGSSGFLYTLGRLAHYLILIIGISIGLSSIGVDLSNFALIAGALSLGIGFGLQAIVSNFVSGLIVLFERSLRIGDFVELSSGLAGEVRAINVRSTLVTTTDMVEILVPNSEFVNGKVINWTLTDASRRIHIPFGVAYGSDKELVRKAALEAALQTPHTVKSHIGREPEVWLTNFGDSSLDFELVVWVQPHAVKRPQRVRAAYYWELETALRKYGIEIPFPQRDIHIRDDQRNTPASPPENASPT